MPWTGRADFLARRRLARPALHGRGNRVHSCFWSLAGNKEDVRWRWTYSPDRMARSSSSPATRKAIPPSSDRTGGLTTQDGDSGVQLLELARGVYQPGSLDPRLCLARRWPPTARQPFRRARPGLGVCRRFAERTVRANAARRMAFGRRYADVHTTGRVVRGSRGPHWSSRTSLPSSPTATSAASPSAPTVYGSRPRPMVRFGWSAGHRSESSMTDYSRPCVSARRISATPRFPAARGLRLTGSVSGTWRRAGNRPPRRPANSGGTTWSGFWPLARVTDQSAQLFTDVGFEPGGRVLAIVLAANRASGM